MKNRSFTTTISVNQTPNEAFAAINNVRGWWSGEVEGATDKPGAEFTYRYKDAHRSTQKVTELIPGKKVAWHVSDSHLSFEGQERMDRHGHRLRYLSERWQNRSPLHALRPRAGD